MEFLATFHNDADNMTALVFASNHAAGGFGVSLRDDDSGLIVPISVHGFQSIEAACVKAQALVN